MITENRNHKEGTFADAFLRIAVAGYAFSGKTSLISCFAKLSPLVDPSLNAGLLKCSISLNGVPYKIEVWDSDSVVDLIPVRAYFADAVVLLLSVVEDKDARFVINKLIRSVKQGSQNVPILLVGNQIDRRNEPETEIHLLLNHDKDLIYPEEGQKVAREINAVKYLECSCETMRGIYDVFYEAVVSAIDNYQQTNRGKKGVVNSRGIFKQECDIS